MKVAHFLRKPGAGTFSIERQYEDVRSALKDEFEFAVNISPCQSRGLLRRLVNVATAALKQGNINHITGDIHYIACLMRPRKTILSIQDCRGLERLAGWKLVAFRLLWFSIPLRRVHRVTVISEYTKHQVLLNSRFPSDRVEIIPPPISSEFQADPKTLDLAAPRVLQVGTAPNKNLARVIPALASLPCTFVIVGRLSQEDRDSLAAANIAWENYEDLTREDLLEQYRRSDIVIFASTYEGFGMPIAEANAIGRPVVTSNLCSMPEVAANAACIVNPFDVSSIRDGIDRIRMNPAYARELVEAGWINAERFRLHTVAVQYANLYREMAVELE